MLYENWQYMGSLTIQAPYCPPLKDNLKTECLVIGGGFTGLHAALALAEAGKKVILLEKRICGGSSSGQSAGFLTPESEEDIDQLIRSLGKEEANTVYDIPKKGVSLIVSTVKKNNFNCDLRKQDSLYFSNRNSENKIIKAEAEVRKKMGLPYKLMDKKQVHKIHPGKVYIMGLRYSGSYGINSFAYTQEMKNLLLRKNAKIFEDTEVHSLKENIARTHLGSVSAKHIIICIDKMKSEFNEDLSKKYYHMQTYLTVSEPLSKEEMRTIYPEDELMCWDTRLIYLHYRPVIGNRIIVGGSSPFVTYSKKPNYSPKIIQAFINNLKDSFPTIKDVQFTHYWSGLIDVTKDLTPIADYDPNNKSVQYALGCAGLPWAAFCGDYLARRVINPEKTENLSKFLGVHRKFFISEWMQSLLGKRISFALSHIKTLMG